ncbi:MAG: hypothetical protein E6J61_10905 [Deltaproteobacteria bacterium]|nr:MAG: hypothetical protein E6J61_10905 [Deltaproteobacteria bacterium]
MKLARVAATCAAALAACKGPLEPPAPPPSAQPPAPAQAPLGQRSDVACAAPLDSPSAREKVRAPAGRLKLGVVGGLKDASDENVAHLRALIGKLGDRGAEVLLATGDVGDNLDEQIACTPTAPASTCRRTSTRSRASSIGMAARP